MVLWGVDTWSLSSVPCTELPDFGISGMINAFCPIIRRLLARGPYWASWVPRRRDLLGEKEFSHQQLWELHNYLQTMGFGEHLVNTDSGRWGSWKGTKSPCQPVLCPKYLSDASLPLGCSQVVALIINIKNIMWYNVQHFPELCVILATWGGGGYWNP